MAPISSPYSGIADLLQAFSGVGSSTLSSALHSPAVQSALQSSSPTDIVQLSDQAIQLQQTAELFGGATGNQSSPYAASLVAQQTGESEDGFAANPFSSPAAQSYSAASPVASDPYETASLSYLA